MKGFLLLAVLFFVNFCTAQQTNVNGGVAKVLLPDSGVKHEIIITPYVGYREIPFLESNLALAICYNDMHFLTRSQEFGCSADCILAKDLSIGLDMAYQVMPFSSVIIQQLFYYSNISNPYTFVTTPEFGCSVDYFQSENTSVGLAVNYQTIHCNSIVQQSFFPSALQFKSVDVGIRGLYYFQGRHSTHLNFYFGVRADLSVWSESDDWGNGYNNQYVPIILSSANNLSNPNNLQLSLLIWGGTRYFILPSVGMQLEFGYGFGTPYYSQLGIIARLNSGNKNITKS